MIDVYIEELVNSGVEFDRVVASQGAASANLPSTYLGKIIVLGASPSLTDFYHGDQVVARVLHVGPVATK